MPKLYNHWRDYPMAEWRWKDFSPQEMACRGTGKLMIDADAMDRLQALRTKLGKPMIVNSAYRSPEHNKRVGGATRSKHLEAKAFDVRMDNHDPAEYIAAARAVGFQAIGTYPRQNFVHVDDRGSHASWGKAFPKRPAAPEFATEKRRKPERDSVTQTRTVRGAVAAGTGTGGAAITDVIQQTQTEIGGIMHMVPTLQWVFVALTLAGIAYTIYARHDDFKNGDT